MSGAQGGGDLRGPADSASFELMVAGLGGQGALFIGRLLAEAALPYYEHTLFFPNYGAAMRGGESECTVILAEEEIDSPVVMNPEVIIVLGPASLDKFQERVRSGGLLIVDATLTTSPVARDDLKVLRIPATEVGKGLGDRQVANLVLLGACLETTQVLPIEAVEVTLESRSVGRELLLSLNKAALRQGARLAAEYMSGWAWRSLA